MGFLSSSSLFLKQHKYIVYSIVNSRCITGYLPKAKSFRNLVELKEVPNPLTPSLLPRWGMSLLVRPRVNVFEVLVLFFNFKVFPGDSLAFQAPVFLCLVYLFFKYLFLLIRAIYTRYRPNACPKVG